MKKIFLLFFLFIFSLYITALTAEIQIRVVADNAKITALQDLNDIPLIQCKKGTVYNVISQQGDWYRIKAALAADFMVQGWIHKSFVQVVGAKTPPAESVSIKKEKPAVKKEQIDAGDWEAFGETKPTQKVIEQKEPEEIEKPKKLGYITREVYRRSAGYISLVSGGLFDYYKVTHPANNNEVIINYNIPFSPIIGFICEGYFINTMQHGLGLDVNYYTSISKYNVEINGVPYGKLSSFMHNLIFDLKYRFFVTEDRKTLALVPRLGFRLIKTHGEDVLTTAGNRRYFFAEAMYYGFNLGLANLEWTIPLFPDGTDLGLKAGYDMYIRPIYKEEKTPSNGFITGESPKSQILNSFVNAGIFLVVLEHLLFDLTYTWTNLRVDFGGVNTGLRMDNILTNARIKENIHTILVSVGYRF